MEPIVFSGQQTDERILYEITPHPLAKHLALAKIILAGIFFFLIVQFIGSLTGQVGGYVRIIGTLISIIFLLVGIWWILTIYKKAKTYITDRRMMRFEMSTPFVEAKRALFWSETLKAKAYPSNIVYKILNIGSLRIEAEAQEGEDILIPDVYMYEDLGNYIDKILFTFKNKPGEMVAMKPFIPKPKGQRG